MDDLRATWSVLRELRAIRPYKARERPERALVFGAALHQCEELMRAAEAVDYFARPLLLFYAISQAGRSIAAARAEEPWQLSGHGLKLDPREPPLRSLIRPVPGTRDSFSRVCLATGVAVPTGPMELGAVWASLPELFAVELPDERWWRPLRVVPDEVSAAEMILLRSVIPATIRGLPNRVFEGLEGEDSRSKVAAFLARYPHGEQWQLPPGPGGPRLMRSDEYGWDVDVRAAVDPSLGRVLTLETLAPGYRAPDDRWLRPTVNERSDALSPLMAWWLLLYGLSMLARYYPAAWTQALDLDESRWAVPLEYALDEALEALPRLVLGALQE
jgi:hypothetical protein